MTQYHLTPPTMLPSIAIQEAKEKRRKVLEKAAQVRRANYKRYYRKMQLQGSGELVEWVSMLTQDDLKAIVNAVSPLIDARAKTTETLFQAEIRASEERVTKRIDEAKEELRAERVTKEQVATLGIAVHNIEVKLTQKVNKHERRIENLEEKTKTNDPTKH